MQGSRNRRVAPPSAAEPTTPVVSFGSAVKTDPYSDAELTEKLEIRIIQADSIRLHSGVHSHVRGSGFPYRADQVRDEFMPSEQRLSAVQDKRDVVEPVYTDVLADAHGGVFGYLC